MKYIALDLGNVVCEVNFNSFIKRLRNKTSCSKKEANNFVNKFQKYHDLDLTHVEKEIANDFGIKNKEAAKFLKEWDNAIKINPLMLELILDLLKSKNTKIAFLSNMGIEHLNILESILTKEVFDNSIKFISCQVGVRKPSYLYYKTFLEMYPEFSGCLYLDDRKENIEAGLKFGFQSEYFNLDELTKKNELEKRISDIICKMR